VYYKHLRARDGETTLFLPTWWRKVLCDASRVLQSHQAEAAGIVVRAELDGRPRPLSDCYRRYYCPQAYAVHEQFGEGDEVGVAFATPDALSEDFLWRLFDAAGSYYGISPARRGDFGRFAVVSLARRVVAPEPREPAGGSSPGVVAGGAVGS
jgi:hypothetical protein